MAVRRPFSAVKTVLNDPIHRFFLLVFHGIQDLMQSIAEHVVANIEAK